jgi:hypothetical protein
MKSTIIRESTVKRGPHIICVMEFDTGEILMRVDDTRYPLQEDIPLREYIDAHEIYYDFEQGWMVSGGEIPYLDSF